MISIYHTWGMQVGKRGEKGGGGVFVTPAADASTRRPSHHLPVTKDHLCYSVSMWGSLLLEMYLRGIYR